MRMPFTCKERSIAFICENKTDKKSLLWRMFEIHLMIKRYNHSINKNGFYHETNDQ